MPCANVRGCVGDGQRLYADRLRAHTPKLPRLLICSPAADEQALLALLAPLYPSKPL